MDRGDDKSLAIPGCDVEGAAWANHCGASGTAFCVVDFAERSSGQTLRLVSLGEIQQTERGFSTRQSRSSVHLKIASWLECVFMVPNRETGIRISIPDNGHDIKTRRIVC